jgi:acyl carrier protein
MISKDLFLEQFYVILEKNNDKSLTWQTVYKDLDEWDSLVVLSIIVHFEQNFQLVISPQSLFDNDTFEDLYNSLIKS